MVQKINTLGSTSQNFYVQVTNQGAFNAYFTVAYSYNNSNYNFNSAVLANTDLEIITVNQNATNIVVKVYVITQAGQSNVLYTKTFSTPTNLKLLLTGTVTVPVCTDITNPASKYYVSVKNTASFIGKIFIRYNLNNEIFNISSNFITTYATGILNIPNAATNIQVLVKISNTPTSNVNWNTVYNKTLANPAILKLSLSGTILNPICTDISNGNPIMQLTKTPDQTIYNIGDTITFTIIATNVDGGDATNIILTDNVPNEANFISSSLTLDGISVDGSSFLNNGVDIPDMVNGDSHTVIYQMVMTSMPASNPVENDPVINYDYFDSNGANQIGTLTGTTTQFTVSEVPVMTLTKTPDQSSYSVGDTVIFTITISNINGETASNVVLGDNIPNGSNFVSTSLTLDSTSVDGSDFLNNGLTIGDMNVGDSHIVTYQMVIVSMPSPNPVKNNPVINYDYVDSNGANQIGTLTGTTNPFTVTPNLGNGGVPVMTLTKAPNQATYNIGNTVTFTIAVSNTNGEVASNVVLTDNIPNGSNFIATSLTLDRINVDGSTFLNNGLTIGDMNVGDSHIVTYQMVIASMPSPNPVENDPTINYDYIDSTGANQIGTLTGTTTPFTVTQTGPSCFCCCCCPCMCNCPDTSSQSYVQYLQNLGYL